MGASLPRLALRSISASSPSGVKSTLLWCRSVLRASLQTIRHMPSCVQEVLGVMCITIHIQWSSNRPALVTSQCGVE
jgi:hypothetical protein